MKKKLILTLTVLLFVSLVACAKPSTKPEETTTLPADDIKVTENVETTAPKVTAAEKAEKVKPSVQKADIPATAYQESAVAETQPKTPRNKPAEKPEVKTTEPTTRQELNISKDKAKEIALAHANLAESDIRFYKSELDIERRVVVYEIEFDAGKYEYDYEINAENGKIVKHQKEFKD